MIKVITGVRRCGKSCLMQCIAEELRAEGVDDEHIVFFDLDRYGYRSVKALEQLEALIEPLLAVSGTKYLFIDEVQNVEGFEDVLNGFRTEGGFSILITGSNSYLLSGELATKLTGRYIEFEMQTLDFGEYCQMKRFLGLPVNPNPVAEFDVYILEGGFPKAMDYPQLADKRAYVAVVIQEIFEKDIRRRVKIKNVSVFNQVRDYVINNFGATTSLANIQSDLESKQGVKIKRETLARYLQILEDAKIVSKCARFDLKSRKSLRGKQKYYLADLSFYFALNTDNRINLRARPREHRLSLRSRAGLQGQRRTHRKAGVRFHLEEPSNGIHIRPGRHDHHGRQGNGGARIPSVRADQGQLPQVPAYAKQPHPAARWHHPCQHPRVHAGREDLLSGMEIGC